MLAVFLKIVFGENIAKAEQVALNYFGADAKAAQKAAKLLEGEGVTTEQVVGHAIVAQSGAIQVLDHLIQSRESSNLRAIKELNKLRKKRANRSDRDKSLQQDMGHLSNEIIGSGFRQRPAILQGSCQAMTTEKQIAANRLNARRSTGPKTHAGKRRASQNALRHGLTLPLSPEGLQCADELGRRFAAINNAGDEVLPGYFDFACAFLDTQRIRHVQAALAEDDAALVDLHVLRQLAMIDRYERRGLTKRKRAVAKCEALRSEISSGKSTR